MFGKTLKPVQSAQEGNGIKDVFYPRGRGRYLFFIQSAISEVHTKVAWFEQDPESKVWRPHRYSPEKKGPRVAVILAVAREQTASGWLRWQGDVLSSDLNPAFDGTIGQRCMLAVYDISPVKLVRDDGGNEVTIYPAPDGKFPVQYEAIKATSRNKPFVLELSSGQLYDKNGDIVGKSAMADLLRALKDGATIDPFSGELREVDLEKQPIMLTVSGEGKETRRTFAVVTMPSKPIEVVMTEAYDLLTWPQPASVEMVRFMMESGGDWRDICQRFGYVAYPSLISYPPTADTLPESDHAGDEDMFDEPAGTDVW